MLFESLSDKLQGVIGKLRGKGKVTEKDIDEAMREVRLALLEADVNFKVVKDFIKTTKERCLGAEVMESLTPAQQIIKIVNEELIKLMGAEGTKLNISSKPPTIILMCGLQGAGKTTTSGKLANVLKKDKKRPLLVACDVYRPAAIKQLEVVGEKVGAPVFTMGDKINPVDIAKAGVEHGIRNSNDVIIIDTAGRLHVDDDMMDEIENISKAVNVSEALLVLDAMTGQDAVNVAKTFSERVNITGVILTKLDGDARGGAALSLRAVTDVPIKFIATGEKLDQLEAFHPDRIASRILGMGDVLSLIERAEENYDKKIAKEMEEKLRDASFTLEDFLVQIEEMKKMGPIDQIIGMLPGMNNKMLKNISVSDKDVAKIQSVIQSMTPKERMTPEIIDSSRKKRIAAGSGNSVQDVNKLLNQFKETKKLMKKFSQMTGKGSKKPKMGFPFM
ncbi:MAG: signal recognition particle protein [Tissierellia bacterium]|nr:signal recognition particle protein [Tissierellia bacterium]